VREVLVTGVGVILPGCDSLDLFWEQLSQGRSQLKLRPDPSKPSQQLAMGVIEGFRPEKFLSSIPERALRQYDREVQLYLASVYSARAHAGVDLGDLVPERIGLFDGCSRPMFAGWYDRLRREHRYTRRDLMMATPGLAVGVAASLLEVRGAAYTFNGTCSSGAIAIGHAFREVAMGSLDLAFATGHESSLLPPLYEMYGEANLLTLEQDAAGAVRPYSDCLGNAFGEGAVTLVLEPAERVKQRGRHGYAKLKAYQYGNNGFHPTSPDLVGGQPARLLRAAIEQASWKSSDVGFVVGHGNGVQLSDASEHNYMLLAFGDEAARIPLLSNKPIYGHTLGASSAVNAAASVMMLHHQFVVPTLNVAPRTSNAGFQHMVGRGEPRPLHGGLAVSFGLGGNNAILAFERCSS
jgi:3-oxoacyl-[acyl-carrier-protein] synthase II